MVRFYIYASTNKVNMLLGQIQKTGFKVVSASAKVELPFVEVSVEAELEARLDRLKAVETYLREHAWVGELKDDAEYVAGTMPLSWGEVNGTVLFAAISGETAFAMTGSLGNLIGGESNVKRGGSLIGATYGAVRSLAEETYSAEKSGIVADVAAIHDAAKKAFEAFPTQRVEFLAKRFVSRRHGERKVVLGSPIYVAMAE
jgi:hypothetical protein